MQIPKAFWLLLGIAIFLIGSVPAVVIAQTNPNYQLIKSMGLGAAFSGAWNPDGKTFAVAGSQGIRLYRDDLKFVRQMSKAATRDVSWSPDGRFLISGGANGVEVWDVASGQLKYAFKGQQPELDHTGSVLVSTRYDRAIQGAILEFHDFTTGELLYSINGIFLWDVIWANHSQQLAISGSDGNKEIVRIFDYPSKQFRLTIPNVGWSLQEVLFSPDDSKLITANYHTYSSDPNNSLKVWDALTGALLRIIQADLISVLLWGSDESSILTASVSVLHDNEKFVQVNMIRQWDINTGALIDEFGSNIAPIVSLSWHPDRVRLLMVGADEIVQIIAHRDKTSVATVEGIEGYADGVTSLAWSPDGKQIISGHEDGGIRVWDVGSGVATRTMRGHWGSVWSLAWHPDGTKFASGGNDRTVRIWTFDTRSYPRYNIANQHGRTLNPGEGNPDGVFGVAWSGDGKYLASGGLDGTVRVRIDFYSTQRLFQGNDERPVQTIAWNPHADELVFASGSVYIWNPVTNLLVRTLKCEGTEFIWYVDWSPDGKWIAGNSDIQLCVWDAATGKLMKINRDTHAWGTILWHPDSKQVATITRCSYEECQGRIDIWNMETEARQSIELELLETVAWSPDGNYLATGDSDGIIKIWELAR